jgi:hypothetical protein
MTAKPWPHPEDTTAGARYKRMVNTALYLLARADPAAADHLVREWHACGETWAGSSLVTYDDTDAITTAEAATLLGVSEATIRRWACLPHPNPRRARQGQMLLSRFGRRGRHQTYLVRDLRAAHREYRLLLAARKVERRHARHHGDSAVS